MVIFWFLVISISIFLYLNQFLDEYKISDYEYYQLDIIFEEIRKELEDLFGNQMISLSMFGSLGNGLASTKSDLDCMLLLKQDEIRYHVSVLIIKIII